MTYAKPEQPVLRTPRRSPVPCPRAARKVLTRSAADSVSEMLIACPYFKAPREIALAASRPVREAGTQGVFDQQQPAEFLDRKSALLRPQGRVAGDKRLPRPAAQLLAQPRPYIHSM